MRFWIKVRFWKNTVLENAVFGIYGFGKTQFFRKKTVSEKNKDQEMRFWRKVRFRKNTVSENVFFEEKLGFGKIQI